MPVFVLQVRNGSMEGAFLSVIIDRITFLILLMALIFILLVTAHKSPV